jgi:cytochrome c553
MKKITLLSLVTVSVLFTACGEETKKVVAEVNKTAVAEAVKKDTVSAVEAAKIKAVEIAEAAKIEAEKIAAAAAKKAEVAKSAAEAKAVEAAAVVKEKTVELKEAASEAVASAMPASSTSMPVAPEAYAKCVGCHGADGKTKALGKSAVIAGQNKEALITSMNEYKAGTKNVAGMGMLMKGQAASMSDADIEAVAEYLSQI